MRRLPAPLAESLFSGVTTLAQAWRLTRLDGRIVAATDHDRALTFDGTVFQPNTGLQGSDLESAVSLTPDRTALSGALHVDAISAADLTLGLWDGAQIACFWVDWTNPSQFVHIWTGRVAGAQWRGAGFELDIVGFEADLDTPIGRIYARTCDARLGDARCTIDLTAAGRRATTMLTQLDSDRVVHVPAGLGLVDNALLRGGLLTCKSGPATGWSGVLADVAPEADQLVLTLANPFPILPAAGDQVQLQIGCDKQFSTCRDRFGNALNFRGVPTLPGDDAAFAGPSAGSNDGGAR